MNAIHASTNDSTEMPVYVAAANAMEYGEAEAAFDEALRHHPAEMRRWFLENCDAENPGDSPQILHIKALARRLVAGGDFTGA